MGDTLGSSYCPDWGGREVSIFNPRRMDDTVVLEQSPKGCASRSTVMQPSKHRARVRQRRQEDGMLEGTGCAAQNGFPLDVARISCIQLLVCGSDPKEAFNSKGMDGRCNRKAVHIWNCISEFAILVT